MTGESVLTPRTLIAAASDHLTSTPEGYAVAHDIGPEVEWPTSHFRVFEDPFGVVAVVAFESWRDLESNWRMAQAALVDLITRHMLRIEAKAWDGYLILLTPGIAGDSSNLERIRYDVSQVRKLVADGDTLRSVTDLRRVLAPLLPLRIEPVGTADSEDTMSLLRKRLDRAGFGPLATTVLTAFQSQQPMMRAIHRTTLSDENHQS